MGQTGVSSSSSSDYNILHSQGHLKRIQHKSDGTKHTLVTVNSSPSANNLSTRLERREHPPSFLTHMQRHEKKSEGDYCGKKERCEVLFEESWPTLDEYLRLRRMQGREFETEEVESVIRAGVMGLREVREMGEEHGAVDLDSIVIGKRQVMLKDPMIVDE